MFANSLVLPIFDYLDIIYSKAAKTKLLDLVILSKKVAKLALDVPKTENSIKVYRDMNRLKKTIALSIIYVQNHK